MTIRKLCADVYKFLNDNRWQVFGCRRLALQFGCTDDQILKAASLLQKEDMIDCLPLVKNPSRKVDHWALTGKARLEDIF